MSPMNTPRIDIVKLEDKEDKLKSFISTHLEDRARLAADPGGEASVLLIARSPDSPVAKAVMALLGDECPALTVRVVFAMAGSASGAETLADPTRISCRKLARDARLLDAHEQLVIGTKTCWVGDCMRRDPNKRDAYECFAADCQITAGWAKTSFERLWAASGPFNADPRAVVRPAAIEPGIATMVLEQTDTDPAVPGCD